ncbi:uncharacterized protein LY89DRAFT_766407 [Mollisia scopiformis]|uniref:CNNM transmembrane domain-containing protein n=1 Tax=Mollisia scopiformis TaxID=149040 RepID=A0A132B4F6_MOLSC|nr:uncharacterized protein LY89DRAFT_766407 [Mollisia scopiformis]KUJ07276.1 hypothetical protein LY89DRAFT_766407 [Mollisia scopiformis]
MNNYFGQPLWTDNDLGRRDDFQSSTSIATATPTPTGNNLRWSTESKNYTFTVYHGTANFAMQFLASNILTTAALISGLILGLCGLNMTLLQLRASTGTPKERKHARAVIKLKKHETWMLCSLIIVSVGLGESFPFLVQAIYPGGKMWVSILVSTLCIAIVGEILPQYIIPRRAVAWGYYCRFTIWACMFITAIISFPLAWLLDTIAGQKDQTEIFTNEELGGIIRHHEKSEKHGGDLGQDTSRIMLGALKLDSREVGGEIAAVPEPANDEKDLEKADLVVVDGMIVKWSAVKAIRIDERVDEAFVKKIRGWSYSRIPVIGTAGKEREHEQADTMEWTENTRIHGFLHIKSLIGIDIKFPENPETPLLVKDLDLYPLPIVREDMSVYELLNLFQSGMSRMALVVPSDTLTCSAGAVWTVTERINEQTALNLEEAYKNHQWSMDYLVAARAAIEKGVDEKLDSPGIMSPKPIGIVTFEDIIDTILQKTSRDEKDFFERNTATPPTKTRKAGDFPVDMDALAHSQSSPQCQVKQVSHASKGPFEVAKNTLRKRKVTNEETACAIDSTGRVFNTRQSGPCAMDGAYENSSEARSNELQVKKTRSDCIGSSYTQNSNGGFHAGESSHSVDRGNMLTAEDIAELASAASSNHPKCSYESNTMRSLPSHKHHSRSLSDELKQTFRHVSAAPKLPTLRRLTSFSKDTASSFEKQSGVGKDPAELVMPEPSTAAGSGMYYGRRGFNPNASGYDVDESMEEFFERTTNQHVPEKSGDTLSLNSSDNEQDGEEDVTCLYDAFPVPITRASPEVSHVHHSLVPIKEEAEKTYNGFPMELLDDDKEERTPKYISSTMPRTMGPTDFVRLENAREKSAHEREQSFHDDRALLPSQRKSMQHDEESVSAIRSTSLWF